MAQQPTSSTKRQQSLLLPFLLTGFIALGAVGLALYLAFRDTVPHVVYSAYKNSTGWNTSISRDGDTCGTTSTGIVDRNVLHNFYVNLENAPDSAIITYAGYVSSIAASGAAGIGWHDARNGAPILDTVQATQTRGIEAIRANLANMPGYALEYRAHFQLAGWTEWLSDGIQVGVPKSTDFMDAFQARLIPSDSAVTGFEAKVGVHVDFSDIYFKTGSSAFNFDVPETSRNLARLYRFANTSCEELQMLLEGHSSAEGDSLVNHNLSEQRAFKVQQWLTSKGIDPKKMPRIKGYGSSQPKVAEPLTSSISATELEAIRKQNRRIGVMILRGCK
jgi:outer membrane protein OmpA-like peptidoglycan-associated protein